MARSYGAWSSFVEVETASPVTGTGDLSISAITVSGSGTLSHTGTGDLQTAVITLDGSGVLGHTGTGDLTTEAVTLDGTGVKLGEITGTGALTTGAVTVYGYDVLPVAEAPRGGGGTSVVSGRRKRQKLILVERVEDFDDLIEQVEEIVKTEPKTRKTITKSKKPLNTVDKVPEAVFDWLGYYQAQLEGLRDQQRAQSISRQLQRNAEIITALLAKQQENARIEQELQIQREEEDFILLLMAA